MDQLIGDIGKVLGTVGTATGSSGGKGILSILGFLDNFVNQQKRNSILNRAEGYANNPAKEAAAVRSLTQPLDAGLVQGVTNETQAYLGERGLSESPQISQAVLSQALAPYEQHNQDVALSEFNESQLLALQAAGLIPGNVDISKLLASSQAAKTGTNVVATPPFVDPSTFDPTAGIDTAEGYDPTAAYSGDSSSGGELEAYGL